MEGQALVLRLSPLSLMTQHTSTLGRGKRQFGEGREGEDGEGSRAFAAKSPGDDADGGPGSTASVQPMALFQPSEVKGEQVCCLWLSAA